MKFWKLFYPRILAFSLSFTFGLLVVVIIASLLISPDIPINIPLKTKTLKKQNLNQDSLKTYPSPEYIVKWLTSNEPLVRRAIYRELFLRPNKNNTYYDYSLDSNYPERAENVELEYVKLDKEHSYSVIIKFVKSGLPIAIIMQKEKENQWVVIEVLSASGKVSNNDNWLQRVSLVEPGVYDLLVNEVMSDTEGYISQFAILKLIDKKLVRVGQLPEEEVLRPVSEFNFVTPWYDAKKLELTSTSYKVSYTPVPRISLEIDQSIIKFIINSEIVNSRSSNELPSNLTKKRFHTQPYKILSHIGKSQSFLEWDYQKQRFIKK